MQYGIDPYCFTTIVYLEHKIDNQGLHPLAEKVEAVQAAPAPKMCRN